MRTERAAKVSSKWHTWNCLNQPLTRVTPLCGFLETRNLHKQMKSIQERGDHLTNVCKMGSTDLALQSMTLTSTPREAAMTAN